MARGRLSRVTPEQREEMVRRFVAGEMMSDIASDMSISSVTVQYQIRRVAGCKERMKLRTRSPQRVEQDARPAPLRVVTFSCAEARRLHDMGRPVTQIAALMRAPYRDVIAALEA